MSRRVLGWIGLVLVVAGVVAMLLGAATFGGRAYPWLPPDFRGGHPPFGAPGSGWTELGGTSAQVSMVSVG